MWEEQREKEREKIPSRLHTVITEPNAGLEPTNCEATWAETKSWMLNELSHLGAQYFSIKKKKKKKKEFIKWELSVPKFTFIRP